MTIGPSFGGLGEPDDGWAALGVGAPTVIGLARLCSRALSGDTPQMERLSNEARAILYVARRRGALEVKGSYDAFEAPLRFLTVHVEVEPGQQVRFRSATDPVQAVRFLEGFRQLCAAGMVLHHLYHEFSLSESGFARAQQVQLEEVQTMLNFVEE